MLTIQTYLQDIQQQLTKHEEFLKATLETKLNTQYPPQVDQLEFTFSADPTTQELTIMLFQYNNNANEIFENLNGDIQGAQEILEDVTYYPTPQDEDAFQQFYEENDYELEQKEQQTIINWFAKIYNQTQTTQPNLPAYATFQDAQESYDLTNKKWIETDNRWQY
ncbi:hypothetical protein [Sutcliffiella deserti]|uniref:hypothetical protein n=1 Tax=Sutcliffiella deserti TaxID=2875501 RepID=UPI001CBB8426|nr:hypothetical protein [Sutcliffiella deserti]